MTNTDFETFRAVLNQECTDILFKKGNDYSSDADRLANFKRLAGRLGLDPMQVWAVYFIKHIDAILTYCKNLEVQSEAIRLRFADARNYLDLGLALIEEINLAEKSREAFRDLHKTQLQPPRPWPKPERVT